MTSSSKPVVLVTGAAGRIGGLLRRALPGDADLQTHYGGAFSLRVTDINDPGPGDGSDEVHVGDLADVAFVDKLFADGRVRAVIHCAGYPREADWDHLMGPNIQASINIFESARRMKTERVLYASSNHATGFYPRAHMIDHRVPQRPDSRYGVIKAFCEDMGFLYAYKFGVRSFSVRIGMFLPEPTTHRGLSNWFSYGDAVRLFKVGLTADYVCEIVYGVSANTRSFWDNSNAMRLGYRPKDNAEAFAHLFPRPDDEAGAYAAHFQGGPYINNGLTTSARQLDELNDPTR
jgi:uronate dehydrogenase